MDFPAPMSFLSSLLPYFFASDRSVSCSYTACWCGDAAAAPNGGSYLEPIRLSRASKSSSTGLRSDRDWASGENSSSKSYFGQTSSDSHVFRFQPSQLKILVQYECGWSGDARALVAELWNSAPFSKSKSTALHCAPLRPPSCLGT